MTINPAMIATYQVGLGSLFLDAASMAARDWGRLFGFRRFDSGMPSATLVNPQSA